MQSKEYETKTIKPASKVVPKVPHSPTMEHLRTMTTDELVKMLKNPDSSQPMNIEVRQMIVKILQEREGNAFVEKLLKKTPEGIKRED